MTQASFYETKRMSPTAGTIVILLHAAALTALVSAKMAASDGPRFTRTEVDLIKPPPPPDPVKPPPPKPSVEPPPVSRIDTPPPIIDMPPIGPTISDPPIKDVPPPLPPGPVFTETKTISDPPPVPPEPKTVQPARAKADLHRYVSDADYPSEAIRREEEGTTRFRLVIGPDGRVSDCTVTGSSGSSALDATTCKIMRARARFSPARDNRGQPTTDMVSNAIRWQLPPG